MDTKAPVDSEKQTAHNRNSAHSSSLASFALHGKKRHRIAVVGATLALLGRIVITPLMFIGFLLGTDYLTTGKAFLVQDDSFFDFVKEDPIMRGGCTGCGLGCDRTLLLLSNFHNVALMSKPPYQDMFVTDSTNVSRLGPDALALAASITANNKSDCLAGINEWGSQLLAVVGTPKEVIDTVHMLNLSVGPQVMKEVILAADPATAVCDTRWALESKTRMFTFLSTVSGGNYSYIPSPDFTISPEDTECRPKASNDGIIGERLALETHGVDLVANVPAAAKIFPYSFSSSLPEASRDYTIKHSLNGITRVSQPLFHAYYGACRVRVVNTTGVYIEDGCDLVDHWLHYGLMLQLPDDVPVCSTGQDAVCVHNVYNSRWEFLTIRDYTKPDRFHMVVNSFRQRYTDSVPLSVLPAVVTAQLFVMGFVSLYQIMSHRRSVLLTQIWAFRCQNGNMQLVYLAQVTYHLAYNSDSYYLGLITGTLSVGSLANLTLSVFVFSYAFINVLKGRVTPSPRLEGHFRLTWEIVQLVIVITVAALLFGGAYRNPLIFLLDVNGELLRKTTARGRQMCNLSDSCLVFTVNLAVVVAVLTSILGVCTVVLALGINRIGGSSSVDGDGPADMRVVPVKTRVTKGSQAATKYSAPVVEQELTSFERVCLGAPFLQLFADCGDFAYVMHNDRKCSSVEAILLCGYLSHGKHLYRAEDVLLLLLGRFVPRKVLSSFNILMLRWLVSPENGSLSAAATCPWYSACAEGSYMIDTQPVP
jgi:hypothetical protein